MLFDFLQRGFFYDIFNTAEKQASNAHFIALFGAVIGIIAVSYLLGSINTSIVISKVFYHDDIRKHGSGNAGLTNTLRTYGKWAAIGTLLGDLLKTAIAVLIAGIVFGFEYAGGISFGQYCYVAGLFAVVGHIFPIYYRFKGGKGVLAAATMALILTPPLLLVLFIVFVGIVAISRYVSLGSVVGVLFYPVSIFVYIKIFAGNAYTPLPLMSLCSILLAILIIWCHRGNMERIANHTERKLSFKKKPEVESVVIEDTQKAPTELIPCVYCGAMRDPAVKGCPSCGAGLDEK
ncbi:MAG: glycerol-3-phosphate 1-O-acyltransferase PlsY [Clostridia bacterium]|nr:glycerol-3-phosphate 1-O-acyltransferase PlsY [Clostridia bacterium]